MEKRIWKVGVCLKAEENPFWSIDVRSGMEEEIVNVSRMRLVYQSPQRGDNISQQKKIISRFIKDGVDAIIFAPADPKKLVSCVAEANRSRIPVVIIDSDLDVLGGGGKIEYSFIGFNDYSGGYQTGQYIKKVLDRGSRIAIIDGFQKGSYAKRAKGLQDALKEYAKIDSHVFAYFDEETAYTKTKSLIKKYPEIMGIFCTSDNMAMGCLLALYEMKRTDVKVFGFDATHAGKLAVRSGKMFSTINTNPKEMGKIAIRQASLLMYEGGQHQKIEVPIHLLTREDTLRYPKQVIQKRKYKVVNACEGSLEFDYASLQNTKICPIVMGMDYQRDLPERLRLLRSDRYYIITDSIVEKIYGRNMLSHFQAANLPRAELFSFPSGEVHKTFTTLNALAQKILDKGLSKKSCLVLLGGGVVGNLAGFLAAILMRGVRFVHVPTTVMAQIDSTTGGKQAVNTRHGKNILGTFYEPEFIYIDPTFIKTLPEREYRSGIAEVVKHGLCQSDELLQLAKHREYEDILRKTIDLKIDLMEKDPRELGVGLALVYGHTVGHALEIAARHALTHGEAISIGMMVAINISRMLGLCGNTLVDKHRRILLDQGLPVVFPKSVKVDDIMRILLYDKKERDNFVRFVLLGDNGLVQKENGQYAIDVNPKIVKNVIKNLQSTPL